MKKTTIIRWVFFGTMVILFLSCQNMRDDNSKVNFPSAISISEDTLVCPERAVTMGFITAKTPEDTSWSVEIRKAPRWVSVEKLHPGVYRVLVEAPRKSAGDYPFSIRLKYGGKTYDKSLLARVERFKGHAFSLDGPKYWKEAVKQAETGDMIRLMNGDFGDLVIYKKKTFSLLITRAAGFHPKVHSITIRNSKNIDIFGLDIHTQASGDSTDALPAIKIAPNSHTIGIHHCLIGPNNGSQTTGIGSEGNEMYIYNNFIQNQKTPLQLDGKQNEVHDNLLYPFKKQ